jgi:hypothetical protein
MSSSKKLTCKGTLRQVFFCLRREGKEGGRVEPEIRSEGQQSTSVADPCHFGVDPDPDPRIHASD